MVDGPKCPTKTIDKLIDILLKSPFLNVQRMWIGTLR